MDRQLTGVGILGCSSIVRRRFLPALRTARNARLTAVGSRNIQTAWSLAPDLQYAPMHYEEVLLNPAVDLVYISLPNHLHEEWTLRALEQGKHVICEKPLGLDRRSVERMVSAAEREGLLLYENIMYLHHPQHGRVRALIEEGRIGTVRSVRAAFGFLAAGDMGFRMRPDEGGGSFLDQARYPLSTVLSFLRGEPSSSAGYLLMRGGLNVGSTVCGVTSQDETFSFSTGFEQAYECWYEVVGERGSLRLDRAYTTPAGMMNTIELREGTDRETVVVPPADHFRLMLEDACGMVQRHEGFGEAYDAARRLAAFAELVTESCQQVQWEHVPAL